MSRKISHIEDSNLVLKICDGDYISFKRLFNKYYSTLCGFASRYVNSDDDAEDIVQEFFIKLWTRRKKLNISEGAVSSYLFNGIRNASINFIRSEKSRQKRISEIYPKDAVVLHSSNIEEEEFRLLLNGCISMLPGRCKEVFTLSRFQDHSHAQIAEDLTISTKTVKNQIWKAMCMLKSCLKKSAY